MNGLLTAILGRKPQKITRFGATPQVKQFWRFTRTWVCHNHKLYYTYVVGCAWGLYQFWYSIVIGYYIQNNYTRSLDYAIKLEKEALAKKALEEAEEEDDYGAEDYGSEAAAEEAPADDAEEE